jgi:hypothetical protein
MESFVQEVVDETKGTDVEGDTNVIVATPSRAGVRTIMKDKDKSKSKSKSKENEKERSMNAKDGTRAEFADSDSDSEMGWQHVS